MRRIVLWFSPLCFLGFFFFYPLFRILWITLNIQVINTTRLSTTTEVVSFTIYQSLLSTLLTLCIGLPAAYLFSRYDFPGKTILRALTAVPFLLPTVVVAAAFNALLGPRGWINLMLMQWLQFKAPPIIFMGTLGAILLAHIFYNTTIIIRIVGNAIANLEPRLEQAARSLGADTRQVWLKVNYPLLLPSLLSSTLLVFLFDFSSFGVILLLGGSGYKTIEVEIFNQAIRRLDLSMAAWLCLIQMIFTVFISLFYSKASSKAVTQINPQLVRANIHKSRTSLQSLFVVCMSLILVLIYVLPLSALPLRSISRLEAERGQRSAVQYGITTAYYEELFVNRTGSLFYVPPIQAARTSLTYAALTVILALAMGFPAASALAQPSRLERVLDPIFILPLGTSAVILGMGFIVSYGKWLATPILVPMAHTLIALPFVIRTLQPAIQSIPDRLREAAAVMGATPFQVWRLVDWPILSRASLAAGTFAFTISMGEFGAALLISRPEFPTIPVAIYRFLSQPGGLNYGQAMAMATILMLITLVGLLLIDKVRLQGNSVL
jgi:thiamine transport system permease protein